ncbi:G1 family glutamic endopeptidase [Streptacidiphilus albus]|uniref:G1 family glutamic endopeptidase n=1 Tax=Streptacidiphilus albus TaxID=105425 RepID=UPI00054B5D39|nr:G1 family glutamic endopeptidase [Streptacidiphilus albus]
MSQRTAARLLAISAGLATVAALATPTAFAAAPAAHHRHAAQVSASLARQESHNLRLGHRSRRNDTVTSGNWSGYAATGASGSYTSVTSSWVQPSVSCGSQDTYSSFWVGLDGYDNSALEQTGTEADCIDGQAEYGAWWEVLPASESPWSVTVEPGDQLTATVTDNGDGTFTMTLADSTQGWNQTTTQQGSSGYQDSSAEVIAEATDVDGQIADLSDFGSVDFTGSDANGNALDSYSPTGIVMQNQSSGDTTAQPGAISDGAFTDTWESSN